MSDDRSTLAQKLLTYGALAFVLALILIPTSTSSSRVQDAGRDLRDLVAAARNQSAGLARRVRHQRLPRLPVQQPDRGRRLGAARRSDLAAWRTSSRARNFLCASRSSHDRRHADLPVHPPDRADHHHLDQIGLFDTFIGLWLAKSSRCLLHVDPARVLRPCRVIWKRRRWSTAAPSFRRSTDDAAAREAGDRLGAVPAFLQGWSDFLFSNMLTTNGSAPHRSRSTCRPRAASASSGSC